MKHSIQKALSFLIVVAALSLGSNASGQTDPLPSWNDGPAEQSITAFVEKVTNAGSPDFVTPAARIATFDNDGTRICLRARVEGRYLF
ncbi:MAG: hypothetical protein ACREOR_12145 [Candidatus Binatia bacterium]